MHLSGDNRASIKRLQVGEIPTVNVWFFGDCGYPLRHNLLTPIQNPSTAEREDIIVIPKDTQNN